MHRYVKAEEIGFGEWFEGGGIEAEVEAIDGVAAGAHPGGRRSEAERLVAHIVSGKKQDTHRRDCSDYDTGLHGRRGRRVIDRVKLCAAIAVVCLMGPICVPTQAQVGPRPEIAVEAPGILGSITPEELAEARKILPAPNLEAKAGKFDFDLRGDGKSTIEQVAKTLGIEVIFDHDYQATPQARFAVNDLDFHEALRVLQAATDSILVPQSAHRVFVARDTPPKRQAYDRMMTVVVPMPDAVTVQEAQEVSVSVRAALDIRRLMVDTEKRLILIRDAMSRVGAAEILIRDLMRPRPQVYLEVQLLTTTTDLTKHYGIPIPGSFPLVDFTGNGSNLAGSPLPPGNSNYLAFGGGKTFMGIGLADAALFGTLSLSFTSNLEDAHLLASDGEAATLKVGTKYPMVTSGYYGNTTGSGQVFTPPPTVTFEDLGLVVKVTPHVHGMEEVTLDIEASFTLLTGTAANGIPVMADREYKGMVRMREGQLAVLAGLMSRTEATTATGMAGLSDIPLIGKLLRENTSDDNRDETLLVLRPHIVMAPPGALAMHEAWVGTESRPLETL